AADGDRRRAVRPSDVEDGRGQYAQRRDGNADQRRRIFEQAGVEARVLRDVDEPPQWYVAAADHPLELPESDRQRGAFEERGHGEYGEADRGRLNRLWRADALHALIQ